MMRIVNNFTKGLFLLAALLMIAHCGLKIDSATVSTGTGTGTGTGIAADAIPAAPTGVAAVAGNTQATISWSASAGAASYNIYYSITSGMGIAGTKVANVTSPYALTGLVNGRRYYFVVTAVNVNGGSAASGEVNATPQIPAPAAPIGVAATVGSAQVSISWTAVADAASYNIYYGTAPGVTTAKTKVTGATSGAAITGLTNNTPYYFAVTAVNAGGESALSGEVSATPNIAAPAGVTATAGDAQITVSWAAVTGAASYNIYYGISTGVTTAGTKIAGVTPPCTRTGFTNGVTYYLVVTAVNAGGESAVSTEVSATPGRASTTIAGIAGSAGHNDATGVLATFNYPAGITTDGTNLYVADTFNHTIRKVVIATGVVTTVAGSAGITGATDNATGTSARFWAPQDITTDGTNLYVTDTWNHTIRKVVIATGVVTTLAGTALLPGSADGTGAAARFGFPKGIATDGANLYVTDSNSIIRKVVIATGVVTTIAGGAGITGATNGTGTAARFNNPEGLATDGTNLYVTDEQNSTIRKVVIATGVVTTIAGTALSLGSIDGLGTAALLNNPTGITTDGANLYVADNQNSTIRKVVIATGEVTTFAGTALVTGSTDGTGRAARFRYPTGITSDGTNLFVTDTGNSTIRQIR